MKLGACVRNPRDEIRQERIVHGGGIQELARNIRTVAELAEQRCGVELCLEVNIASGVNLLTNLQIAVDDRIATLTLLSVFKKPFRDLLSLLSH